MDLDLEELEATRKLNGVAKDSNIEIIEDFINEIKDFELNKDTVEIVNALEDILAERKQDKARIGELESEVQHKCDQIFITDREIERRYISKQKVKELIIKIQEEFNKLDKETDKQIKDKNKDYYKCKENIAIMQTLAYCRDNLEEWLKEDKQ